MNNAHYSAGHLGGLRRFATGITVITILGHSFLGFEQSYAQPLVALATAYSMQILLELADAWANRRRPRFLGGLGSLVDFLLSAHITGLATAMLLYFNEQLWVVAFAVSLGIGSKYIFRAPMGEKTRHIFNPSNFGIALTFLIFPWVGVTMPWQWTAALDGFGDWIIVAIFLGLGLLLNIRFTKRFPVVVGFLVAFILQAILRHLMYGSPFWAGLAPATGVPGMLFTFFMVPDPATTPDRPVLQVFFGASVAVVYFVLVSLHVVFGLFFALTIVCGMRGVGLYLTHFMAKHEEIPLPAPAPAH